MQAALVEHPPELACHRRARLDQRHLRSRDLRQHGFEKHVVRRAEHDRIRARVEHWPHVALELAPQLGAVDVGRLDVLDQPGHGLDDDPHLVGEAVEEGREPVGIADRRRNDRADHA